VYNFYDLFLLNKSSNFVPRFPFEVCPFSSLWLFYSLHSPHEGRVYVLSFRTAEALPAPFFLLGFINFCVVVTSLPPSCSYSFLLFGGPLHLDDRFCPPVRTPPPFCLSNGWRVSFTRPLCPRIPPLSFPSIVPCFCGVSFRDVCLPIFFKRAESLHGICFFLPLLLEDSLVVLRVPSTNCPTPLPSNQFPLCPFRQKVSQICPCVLFSTPSKSFRFSSTS